MLLMDDKDEETRSLPLKCIKMIFSCGCNKMWHSTLCRNCHQPIPLRHHQATRASFGSFKCSLAVWHALTLAQCSIESPNIQIFASGSNSRALPLSSAFLLLPRFDAIFTMVFCACQPASLCCKRVCLTAEHGLLYQPVTLF